MSDSESFSSDDVEFFPTDFPESIPEDSDSSDGEDDDFYSYDISSSTLTLDVGLTFSSWKIAFQHIKQWAHQQGFFVRKGRSEKVQSERRKQTIVCHCEGVPNIKPNKQTKSCRTNCKWHVNLSRPIKNNPDSLIFVTTLLNEHSGHNLDVSACHFEASKAFTKPMLKDIEWMSIHGHLKPLAIKRMLKAKYNRKVYNQDLYKVIYKYRHNNDTHGNDVSRVFEYLEKCKDDDPRWIIYKDWDHETNTLTKLFWMSPKQQETWCLYSDVVLNDNTSKTNRYDMSLSFFVAIDNNMKSRIIAQALMDRETKEAYSWVLQCTIDATGLMPKVFVTDADPGMDAAIRLKYPSTFAIHCIWHIGQNLPLRLKSKLGGSFNQFKNDFYECRNSLEQEVFEKRWQDLLANYPNAVSYLEKVLYPSKTSWARAFSTNILTIDIQTTSRSESVNGTFKRLLHNSNSTLVDILLAVEERLEEEQDNQDYVNWHNTLSITQSTTIASNAFSDIISELKEFTTFPIQKIHYNEMELAFSYDAKLLDRSCIINEDLKDWSFSSDFIEKQEIRQVTFQNLLSSCNETTIKCLWGVSYLTSSEVHHLVILLNNGTYKCSCMSLVTRGMICRHYFSVMLRTSDAQFHIGFLNQRWFISNQLDFRKQPFYPATKFKSESNAQFLALSNTISDFSNSTDEVSKLNINQYASLKEQHLYYVNVRGLTNQAKQIACKSCDESFITLLEEYIDKKNREAINLQHIDVYSGQHQIIDEEVDQENDRTIGNPIIRRPKGRPPGTARFKGPLQTSTQSNEVLTGRKCSLCNRNGHNRATCPMNPNRKKRTNEVLNH